MKLASSRAKTQAPLSLKSRQPRVKEVIDSVEIVSSRKSLNRAREYTITTETEVDSLTERLSLTTIAPNHKAKSITTSAPTTLEDLLRTCCTSPTIHPIASILTCPEFQTLFPSPIVAPKKGDPIIHKIGEASYSEVFIVKNESSEVVIKIIPLASTADDRHINNTQGGGGKDHVPDCTAIADVMREIGITKRMAEMVGGGFVEFVG